MDFLQRRGSLLIVGVVMVAGLFFIGWQIMFSPPTEFSSGSIVRVIRGASMSDISQELANEHIIKHPILFRFLLRTSGASSHLQAGAYLFVSPQNLFVVAYRLVTGSYGIPPVRITFPEGTTVREMATQIANAFPLIAASDFLSAGKQYEGYLFPDTYLFQPSSDTESIIATLRDNFDTKTSELSRDITSSGHSLSDIVIIASLVEKEARTVPSRRIVAGILWNRLAQKMPLQVDAVFGYIYNRDTYSPSFSDLKVDSPYNTYTHTGLPPGPIDNPGLESLDAALHPTKTDYFYYLTGSDDLMHYATTYAGHQSNQKKYLH